MAALSKALRHHIDFCPGSKGGLYLWEDVRRCGEVILVEGLVDYAVLWQAGFRHVTCSLGNHLNARQFQQLCDGPRTVYLTSTPTPMVVAPALHNIFRAVSGRKEQRPGEFNSPLGTIRIASSSKVAMQIGSSRCGRQLKHDVSGPSRTLS